VRHRDLGIGCSKAASRIGRHRVDSSSSSAIFGHGPAGGETLVVTYPVDQALGFELD
jgi:hypothetical protein